MWLKVNRVYAYETAVDGELGFIVRAMIQSAALVGIESIDPCDEDFESEIKLGAKTVLYNTNGKTACVTNDIAEFLDIV